MKKIIALFISLMIFSSCATIITGGASKVAMNTPKNSGTTVSVNGIEKGVTPIQLKVKAGDMITFEKDGPNANCKKMKLNHFLKHTPSPRSIILNSA